MACTGSIPEGPVTLELPADPASGKLRYREEVRHPALPFPKVATGTLAIDRNGRLVRDQQTPEIEIVEIGEDVLTVRKGEDGEPNMLPIPSSMKQMFSFLRGIASSDERTMLLTGGDDRQPDAAGWLSPLGTYEDETSIWIIGCDDQMAGFLVRSADGIERRTLFEPVQEQTE